MDEKTAQDIETLRSWIRACKPGGMVFFGGAGVSTESGIPDFRSSDGLYAQKYPYPPETMISHSFYDKHPSAFFDFYFDRMIAREAQPNACHRKLAELEAAGILRAVITQNIDGLHQAAGARTVHELHGSVLRNYCERCGTFYDVDQAIFLHNASADGVPRCTCGTCGGIIKPDVVLYEESLDSQVLAYSINAIERADLLVVAGTSLVVYPAAGLLQYFRGSHLAIVNMSPTSADKHADLCIAAKVGEVFTF